MSSKYQQAAQNNNPSTPPSTSPQRQSSSSSSMNISSHNHDADVDDVYLDDPTYIPSTDIGSHLSRNYDLQAANNSIPLYICGDCYTSQILRSKDAIRCRDCGYRILYKARMRRPML